MRPLSAADEAILESIDARLARIDQELPPLQPWRTGRPAAGQLHVVRGRTRASGTTGSWAHARPRRWRTAPTLATVAALILVAFLGGRSVERPVTGASAGPPATERPGLAAHERSADPSTATGPARSSPARDPGSGPRPTPVSATQAFPIDANGLHLAMTEAGSSCGILVQVSVQPMTEELLAKLERAGALSAGPLPSPLAGMWLGSDPERAARAFKGRLLVVDRSGAIWVRRPDGSKDSIVRLVGQRTPVGQTIWRSADVVWPADCRLASTNIKALLRDHAGADWPEGNVVDVSFVVPPANPLRTAWPG